MHPLATILVLNFHKALKSMHVRRSTQLKSFAKFIKHAKSRVHYNATGLVCAVYELAKPILINVSKQQSLVLLENASASRYQRELLRKWRKIRYLRTELL